MTIADRAIAQMIVHIANEDYKQAADTLRSALETKVVEKVAQEISRQEQPSNK